VSGVWWLVVFDVAMDRASYMYLVLLGLSGCVIMRLGCPGVGARVTADRNVLYQLVDVVAELMTYQLGILLVSVVDGLVGVLWF